MPQEILKVLRCDKKAVWYSPSKMEVIASLWLSLALSVLLFQGCLCSHLTHTSWNSLTWSAIKEQMNPVPAEGSGSYWRLECIRWSSELQIPRACIFKTLLTFDRCRWWSNFAVKCILVKLKVLGLCMLRIWTWISRRALSRATHAWHQVLWTKILWHMPFQQPPKFIQSMQLEALKI